MNKTYKSLVNWYYIEDWSDYPGPKGRVVPDAEGYNNPSDYDGTELYISQGTIGDKEGNLFIDDEGNDVPFEDQYFEKTNSLKENKMNKELLHMQMLAGIITESEYKSKLIEEMKSINENETLLEYDPEWTIEDDKEKMSGLSFPLAGLVGILKSAAKLGDPGNPSGDSRYFIGMAETILKYLKEGGYKPSEQ